MSGEKEISRTCCAASEEATFFGLAENVIFYGVENFQLWLHVFTFLHDPLFSSFALTPAFK